VRRKWLVPLTVVLTGLGSCGDSESTIGEVVDESRSRRHAELDDEDRLADLVAYFKEQGLPIERRPAAGREIVVAKYFLHEEPVGEFLRCVFFYLFPHDSDEGDYRREVGCIARASVYNPHAKIAMSWAAAPSPSDTKRYERHMAENAPTFSAFREFRPSGEDRLPQLIEHFAQRGLRFGHGPGGQAGGVTSCDPGRNYRYLIEEAPDGLYVGIAFRLFHAESDHEQNRQLLRMISWPSVYNPHCRTAMFHPMMSGAADSPHHERLARHLKEDSDVFRLFREFRP